MKRLVARTYETLNSETMGEAYGRMRKGRVRTVFEVEDIASAQVALRRNGLVKIDPEADDRFVAIMGHGIGWYHSHPFELSENGKRVVRKGVVNFGGSWDKLTQSDHYFDKVGIVVALNLAKRVTGPKIGRYIVGGCFIDGDKPFRFEIGAYYLDPVSMGEHRVRRSEIYVPKNAWKSFC